MLIAGAELFAHIASVVDDRHGSKCVVLGHGARHPTDVGRAVIMGMGWHEPFGLQLQAAHPQDEPDHVPPTNKAHVCQNLTFQPGRCSLLDVTRPGQNLIRRSYTGHGHRRCAKKCGHQHRSSYVFG